MSAVTVTPTVEHREIYSVLCDDLNGQEIQKTTYGASLGPSGKEPACQCRRHGFGPWAGKIPWKGKWQPTPVFLSGQEDPMDRGAWWAAVHGAAEVLDMFCPSLLTKQQQYIRMTDSLAVQWKLNIVKQLYANDFF